MAVTALHKKENDLINEGEFTEDKYPAFGPGGAYSGEDEEFFSDEEDIVYPSITSDIGLFARSCCASDWKVCCCSGVSWCSGKIE